jgi:plasmid stabilization system protein ParE
VLDDIAEQNPKNVGTYENPVARTSLIIVYQVTDETLHIVRIIHAKGNWREEK